MSTEEVLQVESVTKVFRQATGARVAVDKVTFTLQAGRTLAIVGESGSGKTTLVRLIAGLERPTSGTIRLEGRNPRPRPGRPSAVQMVFQDPGSSLNPFFTVGWSITEAMGAVPRAERPGRLSDLLKQVGIADIRARERPSRFSGGQLQRIALARTLAASPRLLLCDEPTSALDVSVQGQILNLLLDLQPKWDFAMVLVTHDLSVARVLADEILVLRSGRTVEHTSADRFFAGPADEYSRGLLEAAAKQAPEEAGRAAGILAGKSSTREAAGEAGDRTAVIQRED